MGPANFKNSPCRHAVMMYTIGMCGRQVVMSLYHPAKCTPTSTLSLVFRFWYEPVSSGLFFQFCVHVFLVVFVFQYLHNQTTVGQYCILYTV